MKKGKVLSKADMKNVTGGVRNVCDPDECVVTIGYWEDGCPEFYHCVAFECNGGISTSNKCVHDSIPPGQPPLID